MVRELSLREALALAGGAATAATPRGRRLAVAGGRIGFRLTKALVKRHPYIATAVVLAELGYIYQDEIEDVARDLAEKVPRPASGQGGDPTFGTEKVKRKLSKANKAMKQAMKATKNNFKQATKIASKANPTTKSKIGKGTSKVKRLARKIRKSIWGKLKR